MPVTIKGLPEIIRKLNSLDDPKVFKKPMTQATDHLHEKIAGKQVRKAPGAFSAMATPGQKRAYWAKVSSGAATHLDGSGYRRSGSAKNWTTKVSSDGRTGEVGIKGVGHARYLWDGPPRPMQQRFHAASGWPRVDEVVKKESDTVVGFFEKEYARQLAK